jgi:gluconolactonase
MLPYVAHDPRFLRLVIGHANLERLASGCRWSEGPAYFAAGHYLIWSDIPNDRMMRFDETDASVSVFRCPSFNSNGNTIDREGRLVSCEHLARRVTRTEHDGSITVLADRYDGRRLNSPNDVVVKSDGSIWFSDPTYGIDSDYEGRQSRSETAPPTFTGSTALPAKYLLLCRTGYNPMDWRSRRMRRSFT